MKKLLAIVLFSPVLVHAQLIENFEKDSLVNWFQFPSDRWELSASEPLHGKYSLHHAFDSPNAGIDRISMIHSPLYADSLPVHWQFSIRYNYHPSGENNWMVYLLADMPSPYMDRDSNIHAYALGVNLTGSDDVLNLYKIKDGKPEIIIHSGFNWQQGASVSHGTCLKIYRDIDGIWTISVDTTGIGEHFTDIGTGIDDAYTISNYTGIAYKYSPANDRKLWFDDLEIQGFFKEDKDAPVITSMSFISPQQIDIDFNEAIQFEKLLPTMFIVDNGIGSPVGLEARSPASISLFFEKHFVSTQSFKITIEEIEDMYGNRSDILEETLVYYTAEPFDLIIDEIMADPEPAVKLPASEYIELFNTSDYDITAVGWKIAVGEKVADLPLFNIRSRSYLIVCDTKDEQEMKKYGSLLPVDNLPAFNNEGQTITILNQEKQVIHSVPYTPGWFSNVLKSDGGWSLEMIDAENYCGKKENWDGSEYSLGGTPGFKNSIARDNPDNTRPYLLRTATINDTALLVTFNESLLSISLSNPYNFSVDQGIFHPVDAYPVSPEFSSVKLAFPVRFKTNKTYELMVRDSVTDCVGNSLADSYIDFGLGETPDSFDLVINELLFDTEEDDEFVEIANRSEKIVDLYGLNVVLSDEYTGDFIRTIYNFSGHFQLMPGQFLAVTDDAAELQAHYSCKQPAFIITATNMPPLPDKSGAIAITSGNYKTIDKFIYNAGFHFEMLTKTKGISLERISFDQPTNNSGNWHSASEVAGFATPGYENSQMLREGESVSTPIQLTPEVFSPDNDGFDDYVVIFYHFENPDVTANIMVFDGRGRLVRQLASNTVLGTEGFLSWDGTNTKGQVEEPGLYVLYSEIYASEGKVSLYKNICVLAKKTE
jgi:hypothetical protein